MTRKLVSKKELKSVYGVPYHPAHIARLEAASKFPKRVVPGCVGGLDKERIAIRAQTFPSC